MVASELAFAMASGPATSFDVAPSDFRFAVAVAAFADLLRGSEDAQRWSLDKIASVARATIAGDPARAELLDLIDRAQRLRGRLVAR